MSDATSGYLGWLAITLVFMAIMAVLEDKYQRSEKPKARDSDDSDRWFPKRKIRTRKL